MNESKMSRNDVPGKFTEWLLSMGCPADKVPAQDKVAEICRGQYDLVWRSLMEKVGARDVITDKRLQVFCDDIRKYKEKHVVFKDSSTVVPAQLSLWKQQADLKKKVEAAKMRVSLAKTDFKRLTDNISNKLAQRSIARTKVEDISRRVFFLRQVAADLQNKKTNLQEARSIAESFCNSRDDEDVKTKLDTCLTTLHHQNAHTSNTTENITSVTTEDLEEQVRQLSQARGDALCARLLEKRADLVPALTACPQVKDNSNKLTPQSVVAHTAALHCSLALEATKNKIHLRQAQRKIFNMANALTNSQTGPAIELLVARSEQASKSARVLALRSLLAEVKSRSGAFYCDSTVCNAHAQRSITQLDKEIESQKEELKRLITALAGVDHKIHNVRECLNAIFVGFSAQARLPATHRGVQLNLPPQSISSLRQFYQERRARIQRKVDISMDMRLFDDSLIVNKNPNFVDELRIYLKKFNLEQNRQLLLESGEKIWTFETIKSSQRRLHTSWLSSDLPCTLLSLSTGVASSVDKCADTVLQRELYEDILRNLLTRRQIPSIDITSQKEKEQKTTDKIKKLLHGNLLEVEKINKAFLLVKDDLKFWSDNKCRKYISPSRKLDGTTYKEYEMYYMENCTNLM